MGTFALLRYLSEFRLRVRVNLRSRVKPIQTHMHAYIHICITRIVIHSGVIPEAEGGGVEHGGAENGFCGVLGYTYICLQIY